MTKRHIVDLVEILSCYDPSYLCNQLIRKGRSQDGLHLSAIHFHSTCLFLFYKNKNEGDFFVRVEGHTYESRESFLFKEIRVATLRKKIVDFTKFLKMLYCATGSTCLVTASDPLP